MAFNTQFKVLRDFFQGGVSQQSHLNHLLRSNLAHNVFWVCYYLVVLNLPSYCFLHCFSRSGRSGVGGR